MSPRKPLTPDDPRHGTHAGLAAHHREGSPKCPTCRRFATTYARELRQRQKGTNKARTESARNAARIRAAWVLVDRYRDEWHAIYLAELKRGAA